LSYSCVGNLTGDIMSRKDYVVIAHAMRSSKPSLYPAYAYIQWVKDCEALAKELGFDNPNFNRDVFLKACGVENVH
jgi:hypothetical protein